ncbi:MAG: hypothetical protein HQK63_05390 [Desulfamplus sp.]|nr:hypothetical protein [Desulfamplus sp.]
MKLKQKRFRFFSVNHCFYLLLVCLWVLPSIASSEENRIEAERQNWEVYTSISTINALLRSDDGKILWVGTVGGLEKRNAESGELLQLFTNLDGLPSSHVNSLLSDESEGLWIGTRGGLAHLKSNGSWQVFNTQNSGLPDNAVWSLLSDNSGGLWIITIGTISYYDRNLVHLKVDGSWQVFNTENSGLPDNSVWSLLSDNSGGLWIGTYNSGLAHLKADDSWQVFNTNNSGLPDNFINSILSDESGGLWIGTYYGGLTHLKSDGSWQVFNTKNSGLPDNYVLSLLLDSNGRLWVGTYWGGLTHLNTDGSWQVFNTKNSGLPYNYVSALLSDNNGDLWIGTNGGGLAHLKSDGSWQVFNTEREHKDDNYIYISRKKRNLKFNTLNSGLLDNIVTSLLSDNNGGLWIGGASGGLTHLNTDGSWQVFNTKNSGLPNNNVSALLSDINGDLWIGTNGGGLAHLKSDGSWQVFDKENSGLPGGIVNSLSSDGIGGVWIGTIFNGLAHFKSDGEWQVFNTKNSGLPGGVVNSLLSDNSGGLWIGTADYYGGGLAHLKSDGSWQVFNTQNSGLPDNYVSSILSDESGGLWIGTRGGGLTHLKSNGSWQVFDTKNSGLPDNYVDSLSLLSDNSGGLWIGTDGGGLAHFLQLGTPEQIIKPNSPEITINWFLNSSSLDFQNVKYIELQRSLSQDGVYETVLDASDKLIRFYTDYSICPKPRVDNCWVTVEGHTPETRTNSDGSTTKGYTLNTPIEDPEWLEGLPRYYRLSAVIEENGKLIRVANNNEAALITPQVEEKPRVELTLDRNAIAMLPNEKAEITVFATSLDLFRGDVALEIESATGNTISNNINVKLEPIAVSLKSGETKPVLLTIAAFSESTQTIKIIPKIQSGYSGKSTSLNVQVSDGTNSMIALSIAHKTKRTRVLDSLTIAGNVIPAQAGQSVVISGNNIKESAESAAFTTDEKGYFQGTVTPIHAGLLTLTANSNGITSNTAEIFILPAKTNIALSSNVNQSTKKGDILRVQGIITPVRLDGTKVNLDIRYLDPANQDAGLQPQFVGGVEIDANGVFYRDVVVPGNGFINVKASLPETSDYLSINTKLVVPIGQPVGEGIIVVSESGNADFQTISKNLGSYVYNALKSRNIPAERIKYLGIADDPKFTNGTANKANLHDSLTNWATTLFSTDDPYKTPLNLYLIGKVEDDNGFRLNDSEVLTADDLAKYLNEAEEIIKTNSKDNYSEYKGFPVTIVLEGTQSGKWIEKIAGNGRIILTSSSDKPIDEGGYAGYDNLGESSFSRYFYQFINYGSDIEGSFAEASYEILKFYRHTQRPVMDADGDGFGTTKFDSYEASGKFIEYRPSGNLRPQIRTTNPDMTINREDTQNNFLWAIATDPENEMGGVFCSISSITDPSNRTVNIEMKQKSDKVNVYEADLSQTYPNLATGCYQAVYYAKDKAGNVSLPEQKFLNVIANSGVFLEAPQIKITTKGNMVTVSWSEVANADGYRLFYAPYPNPEPSDIGEIEMGKQREVSFDGKGFAFYGAVKAYNSNGLSGWSNVEFFNLR